MRRIGRGARRSHCQARAEQVRADFQRLLLVDGVLAGYALFDPGGQVRHLLHPRDERTGVHYSALAMIHAMLEDLFSPAQAQAHLALIERHLSAADGARLFDHPLPYHGGPQQLVPARRECHVLRPRDRPDVYARASALCTGAGPHGRVRAFLPRALSGQSNRLRELVAQATLRQANCYYSSSDAAFADRYQAGAEYARVRDGSIALDGGWRVYSSGAGIGFGLILRHFLGVSVEAGVLRVDPVMPSSLNELQARLPLLGRTIDVDYRVGPSGCGVQRLQLNDTVLAFEREANPHRPGAARVSGAQIRALLRDGNNRLRIELGEAMR